MPGGGKGNPTGARRSMQAEISCTEVFHPTLRRKRIAEGGGRVLMSSELRHALHV